MGLLTEPSRQTAYPCRPTFDLQSHSMHSDGALPPADVVAHAAAAGTELLALTDHDTVDGVPEARAAAARHGIALHARGRAVRRPRRARGPAHPRLRARRHRRGRCRPRCTTSAPTACGASARWPTACASSASSSTTRPLEARRQAGKPIGRPHLADAVLAHPANAQRLPTRASTAATRSSRPTSSPARRPTWPAAGRPSRRRSRSSTPPAASPSGRTRSGTSTASTRRWRRCDAFADAGLDGVEAFYATHGEEQTRVLHEAAHRRAAC